MPPDRSTPLGGVVLAGGYSTRFGETDKAVADLAGTPLIRRVGDRLATVADDIVVNCRDDQLESIRGAFADSDIEPAYATDPVPDRGPLAGIRVGLEATAREYAAVVACDMPFVDPALVELLAERARGRDGAVVRLEDGWYQTTQAVYRADAMAAACADALESDEGRIVAALERLDVATVDERALEDEGISETTFESIDTQEALVDAERRLER
ncbi:molybdenum cofactor guanylyltransferase [Natronolimnohabitans innermongolicus]|uniref:Probable molybdenum cofactor guanylyltransferase n=1 Tax=Natronolimnohabitans innermongolicus JCM 12255 TaxID=1227499 RepID=L9WIE0_9EURY|nr:molybdenum cofactor guanylyltransferase [Natronolimnohabitans innermongolicus]ELY49219.1 molybdopterin-guanine dinucleotide biosynthesis protein A [Natronolimnohabitans innermongolicus JCM 12255]